MPRPHTFKNTNIDATAVCLDRCVTGDHKSAIVVAPGIKPNNNGYDSDHNCRLHADFLHTAPPPTFTLI